MRKRIFTILLIAGLSAAGTGMTYAAGFNIYEAGVRATALGGAFTASADDGSALFYNPAGLSFIEGTTVSMNFMSVAPRFKFTEAATMADDPATAEAEHKGYFLPGMYYTKNWGGKWAWGACLYVPFGLGVEWMNPEEFIGRQVSYDVSIETVYITPAVSYKVTDQFAVSIGLDVAIQKLKLQKYTLNPSTGTNAIDTTIEGTSDPNFSFSGGMMYRPDDKLSLGLMYHHSKTMTYEDQDATLEDATDGGSLSNFPTNILDAFGGGDHLLSADFSLPNFMSAGVAYQFCPRFRAEVNYVWFGWSEFEKLSMEFDNDPESVLNQDIVFDYEDSWQIRFGMDYVFIPDRLNLMAGYVYDTTPQPLESVSPLLPDSDRNDFSFGAQLQQNNWDLIFSYMLVVGDERTTIEDGEPANPDPAYPVGSYKSLANIFGLGVTYHF